MKIRLWASSRQMSEAERVRMAKRIRKNAGLPKAEPVEFVEIPDDYVPTAAEMQKSKRGGVEGG